MKASRYIFLCSTIIFSGCAVQNTPQKRPMQEAYKPLLSAPLPVNVPKDQKGVAVSYFAQDSSAAGAQYGLVGALTTAVIDGIANASPASIAEESANKIGEKIKPADVLAVSLKSLVDNKSKNVSPVSLQLEKLVAADLTDVKTAVDGLHIRTEYSLNEPAEVLRIVSWVSLVKKDISYKTPYTFKGKTIPKEQIGGPIYNNVFTYYSSKLTTPVKTQAAIDQAVAAVEAKYKTASGAAPKKDTPAYSKMTSALKKAKNPEFSTAERVEILTAQWLANDAALLKKELAAGNAFLATQLYSDLNDYKIPDFVGADTTLEKTADGRMITKIGSGVYAGSIQSLPHELIQPIKAPIQWGNVLVYAEDQVKAATALKQEENKATKTKAKAKKKK